MHLRQPLKTWGCALRPDRTSTSAFVLGDAEEDCRRHNTLSDGQAPAFRVAHSSIGAATLGAAGNLNHRLMLRGPSISDARLRA